MTTYKLNPNASIDGTSKQAELHTTFAELLALFGMPEESDGHKSSGDWIFESNKGDVFTIYDWKATNLYDPSLPSVDEFRRSPAQVTFSVGGRGDVADFLSWVSWRLRESTPWDARMAVLEHLDGLTTSDAQGVIDAEWMDKGILPTDSNWWEVVNRKNSDGWRTLKV